MGFEGRISQGADEIRPGKHLTEKCQSEPQPSQFWLGYEIWIGGLCRVNFYFATPQPTAIWYICCRVIQQNYQIKI